MFVSLTRFVVCVYCLCVLRCSYYGYAVTRRLGGQLFSVLVLLLLLLLLLVFAFKLANSQSPLNPNNQHRPAGFAHAPRSKTTFTGGLRAMGKSAKAQL